MSERHPWRRIGAWAVDCGVILGWVAVTAAVGIPLYLSGAIRGVGPLALNVVGALVVVVPVVVGLAMLEHLRGATAGKALLGLVVRHEGRRPTLSRALLRNAIKVAAPWLVGHAAVIAVITDPTPFASGLLVAAYVLPVVYVVSLFVRRGRTAYDAAAGTRVVGRADDTTP
ncbi:RDD family protein [Pseudolysinimonas sp.]|uniref:RDD family protein n=1 Tax=Pseudolysinimonas sp. TaxID=2680009 RepID=UPI003F812CAC